MWCKLQRIESIVFTSLLFAACCNAQPVVLPPIPSGVQTSTSFGIQFSTITPIGNRPAWSSELYFGPPETPADFGSVSYEYRLSRTEITYGQVMPFIQAWIPSTFYSISTPNLFGRGIVFLGGDFANPANYILRPGYENAPAQVTSIVGLMFCNWLTNGQSTGFNSFYTGSYDLRSFAQGGAYTGAVTLPTAQYWIPSVNEWTRGMHFDPNRYGPGMAGYWLYPFQRNTPAVPGLPGTGGETDATIPLDFTVLPVGAYAQMQSPWGLLGGSGGASEFVINPRNAGIYSRGSERYGDRSSDLIDDVAPGPLYAGIRLAGLPIPTPAASACLALLFGRCLRRENRI